ncbi:uncharacterized protein L201_001426 [Kwoniella dendrophila CBS 6074]|uniref:Zn(2)-C6 fungal-type domain-containing protein n=1 Tax=Kwoniella dendrophila CBS 6074 TaxID=1295534 RepID=A0AAX4JMC7_9TREE
MAPSAPPAPDRRPLAKGSACEGCKSRKVRCGAEKPTCLNCAKHGKICEYPQPKKRNRPRTPSTNDQTSQNDVIDPMNYEPQFSPSNLAQVPVTSTENNNQPIHHETNSIFPIQSFHPSAGTEGDQPMPEMDFSWLIDLPGIVNSDGQEQVLPDFDEQAKDHSLWLYFSNQTATGLEMNIARFYKRINSPDPAHKPHAALLNAMSLGKRNIACRFAEASCFDRLPATLPSVPPGRPQLRRFRKPIGGYPGDIVELADSIYAFWSVVMLDLCAAVATGIPAHFDPLKIRTPLPKSWSAYVEPSAQLERYISDLLQESTEPVPDQCNFPGNSPAGAESTLLNKTIERFAQQIPPQLKTMHMVVEGEKVLSTSAITLHFIVCGARIYAADTNSYDMPNDAAVYQVRRMVDTIRSMGPLDLAMMSVSIYILWVLGALLLMREVKRLNRLGETIAVAALEADVDFIIGTLTMLSIRSPLLQGEVQGLIESKFTPPSDVDPEEDAMRLGMDYTPVSFVSFNSQNPSSS